MAPLFLNGHFIKYAVAASAHGLADLYQPRETLLPYTILLPLPLPSVLTNITFFFASACHFSNDVGIFASVMGHVLILVFGMNSIPLATDTFCLFYLSCHVPFTLQRLWKQSKSDAISLGSLITVSLIATHIFIESRAIEVGTVAQRLVIAHAISSHRTMSNSARKDGPHQK